MSPRSSIKVIERYTLVTRISGGFVLDMSRNSRLAHRNGGHGDQLCGEHLCDFAGDCCTQSFSSDSDI